jgi:2-hydroxymuconate-semialdehyde hydrolase
LEEPVKPFDLHFGEYAIRGYEAGAGKPLLLIHGIGPGTSIPANFSSVVPALAGRFHVYGCDFVGFGGSARKSERPYFDFPMWIRQAQFFLDRIPAGPVYVFGHSMGGAIALRLAAANSRIVRVMTSGAAGGKLKLNEHVTAFWKAPRSREDIRAAMRVGMHDVSGITDQIIEERYQVVRAPGYPEYFEDMLGADQQRKLDQARVPAEELARIDAPVLVMHGRNDRPCPAEETALEIYRDLRHADLHLFANCGHAIPREYPERVVALARLWFN